MKNRKPQPKSATSQKKGRDGKIQLLSCCPVCARGRFYVLLVFIGFYAQLGNISRRKPGSRNRVAERLDFLHPPFSRGKGEREGGWWVAPERKERTHGSVLKVVAPSLSLSPSLLVSLSFSLSVSLCSLSFFLFSLNNSLNNSDNDRSSSWVSLYTRPYLA